MNIEAYATLANYRNKPAVLGAFVDVTEREQTMAALLESEEKWKAVYDNAPDMYALYDAAGNILDCNKVVEDITGYKKIDVVGKNFSELGLLPKDQMLKARNNLAKRKLGETSEPIEYMIKNAKGEQVFLEMRANPVNIQGEMVILSSIRDITERKHAEEALRISEENFRNSLDKSPLGIRIMSMEEEILYANKALLDTYGYEDIEEMKNTQIKERLTPESYTEYLERMENQKNGKPIASRYEVEIIRKDGDIRTLEVSRGEVVWNNEAQLMVLCEDITERKRLEAEREEIQRQVQIAGRLATVGEMAAGIAHEINNPLTGVVGFADLLTKKELPEDIRKDVEMISEGSKRVAEVTSRMLTFARQNRPLKRQININEVIETTLEMRSSAMSLNNINVITEMDTELPKAIADGGQLQQVFLNIIINAEKEMSTAHGKGNLTVKTERVNDAFRISFKDDGPGISNENLEKIFNPFYTTRGIGEGTGLGLSICHGIITEHGGRIHAESELGNGASFIIYLPLVTETKQLESAEPEPEEVRAIKQSKILVVDDDPLVNQFLVEVLTNEGHNVDVITNGNEATQQIINGSYDVILMDVKLPGKNGIDIYEQLLDNADPSATKVIFITGDIMNHDAEVYVKSAGIPYITKPIDIKQLNEDIANILVA